MKKGPGQVLYMLIYWSVSKRRWLKEICLLHHIPCTQIKVIVYTKMKIPSLLTHPLVISNLYNFLSSAEHKGR